MTKEELEKEAREYRESKRHKSFRADVGTVQINYESYLNNLQEAYLAGAEFGYNKANEWHYVKDELPELYKDVLVVFSQGNCDVKRLTNHNEWVGRGSWCSLTDVIAWKEIVLPKESE